MLYERLKIIYYFYKPYPKYMLWIVTVGVFSSIFETLNVAAILPVIGSVIESTSQESENGVLYIIQKIIHIIPVDDILIATILLFLTMVVVTNLLGYCKETLSQYSAAVIRRDLQLKLYDKFMKSDYQYLVNTKQGANLFLTITAPGQLGVLFNLIPRIITEVLLFVVIMFFLLSLSFYLTVIIFIVGVLFYYLTKIISQKVSYMTGIGRIEVSQVQNITANEAFNGVRQIMVFNARNYWLKKFEKATNAFFNYVVKDSLFANIPSRVLYILSMSVICFGAILGKKMLGESFIGYIPLIGVYYLAFQRILPSMSNLGNYRLQYMKSIPFAEKVYNVLKQKSNFISDGSLVFDSFKKDIRFVDVSFSHRGREKTLKNLSLTFNKNNFTAIVGPSGAGKSTIVDLIVRLFECQSGKILIDGIDLKDIKLSSWLDKIGFVSQDTFIYNATIYDNITFGLRDVSKEDVYNSARLANAHDFILELPDGYETEVGDRGLKLSGGQRQRIAIARALLRDPEIIILDEATSSLDNVSEKLFQDSIERISESKTVITVAHRLSTIMNADKIYVINGGTKVEEGTHEELLARKGIYWQLYREEQKSDDSN